MDSARLLERNLYRCEEIDPVDYSKYPLASNEEFAYMETLALDTSTVHLFPFLRKGGKHCYVELYFYDIMLYPLASYKRFIICDGFRMKEEDEDEFLAYADEPIGYSTEFKEIFGNFVIEVMTVFPHWHFKDYSVAGTKAALLHMYYASHRSGPREILYKANLDCLAFRLYDVPSYNLIGTTPEDIFDVPLKLLKILNLPLMTERMFDEERMRIAEQVYQQYASFLGNSIPSGGQWCYLEELYTHGGIFAGHSFMRSLYNRLKTSSGSYSLEAYRKFLLYRDQMPKCIKLKLPDENDIYDEVEKLEAILEYSKEDDETNRLIQNRKNQTSYEYEGEKYFVRMPTSSLDFCMESISQSNCLLDSYIEEHAEGETTILFLRRKEEPKKSFITLEVDNDHTIRQAYGSCNSMPPKDVYLFLKEYAQHNWLLYDPYSLISESIGVERVLEDEGNDELKEYFVELKEKHDKAQLGFEEDTTRFVQLCFLDCISTDGSVSEQLEEIWAGGDA